MGTDRPLLGAGIIICAIVAAWALGFACSRAWPGAATAAELGPGVDGESSVGDKAFLTRPAPRPRPHSAGCSTCPAGKSEPQTPAAPGDIPAGRSRATIDDQLFELTGRRRPDASASTTASSSGFSIGAITGEGHATLLSLFGSGPVLRRQLRWRAREGAVVIVDVEAAAGDDRGTSWKAGALDPLPADARLAADLLWFGGCVDQWVIAAGCGWTADTSRGGYVPGVVSGERLEWRKPGGVEDLDLVVWAVAAGDRRLQQVECVTASWHEVVGTALRGRRSLIWFDAVPAPH